MSAKCGMVTRPRKTVQLVGCAQGCLQMLVANSGRKAEKVVTHQAIGVVTMIAGSLDAEQLKVAFNKQFVWGADWKVSDYGGKRFLLDFPSKAKLEEMCSFFITLVLREAQMW